MFNDFVKRLFLNTASEQEALGAILNDPDNRDIQLDSFQDTEVAIPKSFITSIAKLTRYSQGSLGTCVAHVLASIKQFNELLDTKTVIDFSRRFIYHLARKLSGLLENSTQGLPPRIAAKVLVNNGACEATLWPEIKDSHSDYSLPSPTPLSFENALDYRVKGYAFGGEGEDDIKRAIINNGVVGISLPVDRTAFDRKTGQIKKPNESRFSGRHYVLAFGFDGHKCYILNSWGASWGNKGVGYFDFRDYAGLIRDVVAITDIPRDVVEASKNMTYIFTKTLRVGDSGEAVKKLQNKLRALNFFFEDSDGKFGPVTKRAVVALQVANKITADGIVGPKTNDILNGVNTPIKKRTLVEALIQVESGGNDNAIGDKHLTDKAYGCLQIRKPCVSDVNKIFGTNYTAEQMLGNRQLSLWVFNKYMELYAVERKLGRPVTDEDRARIWNGGPTGYKRDSTIPYWEKVEKLLM